eukprot:44573-Amphidinium_carterae.1
MEVEAHAPGAAPPLTTPAAMDSVHSGAAPHINVNLSATTSSRWSSGGVGERYAGCSCSPTTSGAHCCCSSHHAAPHQCPLLMVASCPDGPPRTAWRPSQTLRLHGLSLNGCGFKTKYLRKRLLLNP